ncbi:MAG: AbrB/MazE/SpoVT family DNA-binding domain-containing protein [Deltaproteobacteria bacterium]|jgi:antitoxin VapB|nr:AbrB/MazE/SpoVT family DNA-binding domain-containing protein [Deltaproteobacteria bacterium]
MKVAKLFKNGGSQAVRLPAEFKFECDEVYIKKTSYGVLLIPKSHSPWKIWREALEKYDFPFMEEERQQGEQLREGLDELFD